MFGYVGYPPKIQILVIVFAGVFIIVEYNTNFNTMLFIYTK